MAEDKEEMDFDGVDHDAEKEMFQKNLDFPIDEDMVNLGIWLQLNHPNFFDSSMKGHLRYIFWFLFTIINLAIQIVFVVKFRLQALTDTIEPTKRSW